MGTFYYKAVSAEGELQTGELVAADLSEAIEKIHKIGCIPIEAGERSSFSQRILSLLNIRARAKRGARIKLEEFVLQLASLMDAEIPLDEALPTALAAVRIPAGDAFKVAWELYGLRVGELARVQIGVNRGRVGLGRRLGEFLRFVEPNEPVVITYEDTGPDVLGTVFRAVELDLSDLEPGDYTLTVEIELAGREPLVVDRPITIVP